MALHFEDFKDQESKSLDNFFNNPSGGVANIAQQYNNQNVDLLGNPTASPGNIPANPSSGVSPEDLFGAAGIPTNQAPTGTLNGQIMHTAHHPVPPTMPKTVNLSPRGDTSSAASTGAPNWGSSYTDASSMFTGSNQSFDSNAANTAMLVAGASSMFEMAQNAPEMSQKAFVQVKSFVHNMRSWKEFVWPLQKPADSAQAVSNITKNLNYFQTNYMLLFLLYLCYNILNSFWTLALLCIIVGGWILFLRKNEDPNWEVIVAGISFTPNMRYMSMLILTLLLILFVCGNVIFSSCMIFGLFAAAHASIKCPPQLEEDDGSMVVGNNDPERQGMMQGV